MPVRSPLRIRRPSSTPRRLRCPLGPPFFATCARARGVSSTERPDLGRGAVRPLFCTVGLGTGHRGESRAALREECCLLIYFVFAGRSEDARQPAPGPDVREGHYLRSFLGRRNVPRVLLRRFPEPALPHASPKFQLSSSQLTMLSTMRHLAWSAPLPAQDDSHIPNLSGVPS